LKSKIAIFASGQGSNFEKIYENTQNNYLNAEIVLLVVDKENAKVIERAKKKNIETLVFNPKKFINKAAYEEIIKEKLLEKEVDLIVLAGYMRLIGKTLLTAYNNRIINIHPSLLPAFKGKDAIKQAFDYGVKVVGVSIHYVDSSLDGGKIIAQEAISVNNQDLTTITKEIHQIEYNLYSKTIKKLLEEEIK